jgi:hypothetical protein
MLPMTFSGSAALRRNPRGEQRGGGAPRLAHEIDRFRQRELLAGNGGDEPAAANLAARFEPAENPQQLAPRRKPRGLALEEPPEDDPVAAQQRVGDVVDDLELGPIRCPPVAAAPTDGGRPSYERPAAGVLDAEERCPPAPSAVTEWLASVGRREQRAQSGKAVGMDEPERHEPPASASSTCVRRRPVASTISSKNEAPWPCRCSITRVAPRTHHRRLAGAGHRAIPKSQACASAPA